MRQHCVKHNIWYEGRCARCAIDAGEKEVGFEEASREELITTHEVGAGYRANPDLAPVVTGPRVWERVLVLAGVPPLAEARGDSPPIVTIALLVVVAGANAWAWQGGLDAVRSYAWSANDPGFTRAAWSWMFEDSKADLVAELYFMLVFGAAAERRMPKISFVLGLLALGVATLFADRQVVRPDTLMLGPSGVVSGLLGMAMGFQMTASARLPGDIRVPFPLWALPWVALCVYHGIHGDPWAGDVVGFVAGSFGAWFVEIRLKG